MTKINTRSLLILNPLAGNGAAGRRLPLVKTLARKFFLTSRLLVTERAGQATEYGRQALEDGYSHVVCIGGDGTLNEVVNGLLSRPMEKSWRPKLGYLPVGTGSDLAKTLGITADIEEGLRNIATRQGRWVDVGRATYTGPDQRTVSRHFINVLSFALGGEVVRRVNRSSKALGGFLSFLPATLAALFSFEKPRIRLRIDERLDQELVCWHVAVANGQYQGGGMRVAPTARIDDGRLRVTIIGDLSLPEIFLNLPKLYNGGIESVAKVAGYSARKIEADSPAEVLIDLDGEQVGRLPLKVEILPLALWLIY